MLSSNRLPDTLPVPGHGVLLRTGIEGRGWLSGISLLGLGGASDTGGCTVVGLGAAGLILLGIALFLFSVALSCLMLGVGYLAVGN